MRREQIKLAGDACNDHLRPCAQDQLVFCNQLARAFHQSDQDFKRPGTNRNTYVVLEQESAIGVQAKRTKRDRGVAHSPLLVCCFGRSQAGLHVI